MGLVPEVVKVSHSDGMNRKLSAGSTRDAKDALAIWEAVLASNAVIEFDLDGIVLSANANFLALMGYTEQELIGQHHSLLVSPEDKASEGYKQFWQTLRKGTFFRGECRRLRSDGRDIWLQASYNPVLNGDGEPIRVVKVAADITATKNHLAALTSMTTAMNRSLAVVEFSPDGTILRANDIFLRLMGYSLEEIIGRHHRIFVDKKESASSEYSEFWQALGRGESQRSQFRRFNKTGGEVWLEASYNPILDANGELAAVLKFAYDVTETYNLVARKIGEKTVQLERALEESRKAEHLRLEMFDALQKMSTPVTPIWHGILMLPVVGIIDSKRSEDIMDAVLSSIEESKAKEFILDISGVGVVDTAVANYLINIALATRLMGCHTTISGISPSISRTITKLGIQTGNLNTTSTMMDARISALDRRGLALCPINSPKGKHRKD